MGGLVKQIVLSLVAAATLSVAGFGNLSSAHAEDHVKVGLSKQIGFPGVPVGIARGYFKQQGIDVTKLHVTFLAKAVANPRLDKLDALAGTRDQYRLTGREIYLHCPINYGETKLSNNAIERVLAVGATTRNWKTVTTLCEMATE